MRNEEIVASSVSSHISFICPHLLHLLPFQLIGCQFQLFQPNALSDERTAPVILKCSERHTRHCNAFIELNRVSDEELRVLRLNVNHNHLREVADNIMKQSHDAELQLHNVFGCKLVRLPKDFFMSKLERFECVHGCHFQRVEEFTYNEPATTTATSLENGCKLRFHTCSQA